MQERFEERMSLMQEELEQKRNLEKTSVVEQVAQLRRDYSASISSCDENSESIKELEPYTRMQSIAHTPPSGTPSTTPDLSSRVVIGEERKTEVHSLNPSSVLSEQDDDIQSGYVEITCVDGEFETSYLDDSLQTLSRFTDQVDAVPEKTTVK